MAAPLDRWERRHPQCQFLKVYLEYTYDDNPFCKSHLRSCRGNLAWGRCPTTRTHFHDSVASRIEFAGRQDAPGDGSINRRRVVAHGLGSSAQQKMRSIYIHDRVTLLSVRTFLYDIGDLEWLRELYVNLGLMIFYHPDTPPAPALRVCSRRSATCHLSD